MAMKYVELMKECKLTLDNEALDPAFVTKVKEFEQMLANKELTDDEIAQTDQELTDMLNAVIEEEDSEEVQRLKYEKDIAEGKAAIADINDLESLKKFAAKYKSFPELQPLIAKREEKIKHDIETANKNATDKLLAHAKEEIAACPLEDLQALADKYKQYPELVDLINKKIAEEKPKKEQDEMAAMLRSKKEWTYKQLEALGIKPTGNDMTVAGVRLEKEYMFAVYSVRK